MSGEQLPEGSWGKKCNESGFCGNGPATVWCAGSPDSGGCYGGGVGLRGIAKMSQAEVHASTEKFYGTWKRDKNKKIFGLNLLSAGMLDAAGLQPGDVITEIDQFKVSDPAQLKIILNWRFTNEVLSIKYLRDGVEFSSKFTNPYKV